MAESATLDDEKPDKQGSFWLESGLQEFVNSGNCGFHVSAKVFPEDFVVTEVDGLGNPVVLDNYETPEERGCESVSLASGQRKKQHASPVMVEKVLPLEELVTSGQLKMMQDMADSYRRSQTPDCSARVNLGVLQDKWKGHLYLAVRLAYPVLLTRVIKDAQGERCMLVLHEPRYSRLLEVLSPGEAEQVLLFANDLTSSTTLKLAYKTAEEWTKLPALLNFLFKSSISTKLVSVKEQQVDDDATQQSESGMLGEDDPAASRRYIELVCHNSKKKVQKLEMKTGNQETSEVPSVFTRFVLKKNQVENNFALKLLSTSVGCPVRDIKIQGLKDKKAITLQEASIKNVAPARLLKCRPQLLKHNIDIGNVRYSSHPVMIGGHSGNHFDITLRKVSPGIEISDEQLGDMMSSAVDSIKEKGFINYFGQQRYGLCDIKPLVGLSILRNDMKEAVLHALSRGPNMSGEVQKLIQQKCFHEAAEKVSRKCVLERMILQSLAKSAELGFTDDQAYMRALSDIPQELRAFYLQSFCSVFWNHIASYRIKEYGLRLVEGDLVVRGGSGKWWERELQDLKFNSDWVHPVSAADVSSGCYGVHDVLLPMLGSSVQLPNNKVGDRIKEMMAVAGITLASFRIPRLKMYYGGIYRRLLAHPKNLSWSFHQPQSSCPESTVSSTSRGGAAGSHNCYVTLNSTPKDKEHSLIQNNPQLNLKFELGRGMFATMLLRELTRMNIK